MSDLAPRYAAPGRFRSAVGWSFAMTGGQQAVTLVMTFVLAGILGPRAFGVITMAIIYVGFIEMLMKQGLLPALVQRQVLTTTHSNAAFWLVIAFSGALTLVSIALAPWWARVNDLPNLAGIIIALSPLLPLSALSLVQEALLRRQSAFKSLAMRTNMSALVGGFAGIALALAGADVWALVGQQLVNRSVDVLVLWRVSSWRPSLSFSRRHARDLLGFSGGAALNGVGVYVGQRLDTLLTGLFFGPVAAGIYRLGTRLVDVVVDVTARALQQASLPELARIQDDDVRFARRTEHVLRVAAMLSFPTFALLVVGADLLPPLLGSEWEPAVTALRLLCLVGAVRALTLIGGTVLNAIGRPHRLAAITWTNAALGAVAFVVVGTLLEGASTSRQVALMAGSRALLYCTVILILYVTVVGSASRLTPRRLAAAVRPGAMVGGMTLLAGAVTVVVSPLGGIADDVLALVAAALTSAALVLVFDASIRSLVTGLARRRGGGRSSSPADTRDPVDGPSLSAEGTVARPR